MESNGKLIEQQLLAVERAEAAPWVDYPPTPGWYYPACGLWFAAMCLAFVNVVSNPAWIAPIAILVVLEVAFIRWMRNRRAATPNLRTVPVEFQPLVSRFVAAAIVITVVTIGALIAGFDLAAFVFCAAATAIGLYIYEQKFESAAEAARTRLALL